MSNKKFLVCGLGKVGRSVADTLDKMFFDVVAIDNNEKVVESIRQNNNFRFMCYVADATDQSFVNNLRAVSDFNVAIVVMRDFLTRMLCTKIVKDFAKANHKNIEVIAWASNLMEEGMLKDLGAARFIRVEENLGKYLAYTASCDSVLDFNSLRLKETVGVDKVDVDTLENAYAVMSVSVPSYFKGRNIKDFTIEYMDDSQKIVGVYSPGSTKENDVHFCDGINFSNHPLAVGDTLIICGQHEKLKKLLRNIPS